jgi:hypothetical protein
MPDEDYMADISGKIEQIKRLIDGRCYFTINRARQYGKTTMLAALERALKDEYIVASISFEGLGAESFASAETFCLTFMQIVSKALRFASAEKSYIEKWVNKDVKTFIDLGDHITNMCEGKKVVLMIDEVDKTSNNLIFLHFLSTLREKFLARKAGKDYTFHSVILAGVYDIENIKLKMVREGLYTPTETEDKIYNSPWNIAVDFKVDMSFCPAEIATMLNEYESGHSTSMDIAAISEEIYSYTNGYPFLVSRICQCVDEEQSKDWTISGIQQAVNIIIHEQNTLFDDIYKNLENNKKLYRMIYDILILGKNYSFKFGNPTVELAAMFGIIQNKYGGAAISNRIFETIIYDYFISKDQTDAKTKTPNGVISDIVKNGKFDMEFCLRKFADHYYEMFTEKDVKFLERHGRLLFLSYLRPLINGRGFYHIESETRDQRRMDIVVDYGADQFIIELKIWDGESEHREAYEQLLGYMDAKKADIVYLMTFDFRRKAERKAEWVAFGGKKIFDVIV